MNIQVGPKHATTTRYLLPSLPCRLSLLVFTRPPDRLLRSLYSNRLLSCNQPGIIPPVNTIAPAPASCPAPAERNTPQSSQLPAQQQSSQSTTTTQLNIHANILPTPPEPKSARSAVSGPLEYLQLESHHPGDRFPISPGSAYESNHEYQSSSLNRCQPARFQHKLHQTPT